MSRVWEYAPLEDNDTAPCQRCEKPVVLDHDPPCPHGYVGCPECGHVAVCRDCYHNAELEEWARQVGPPHDLDPAGRTNAEVAAEQAADMRKRQAEVERIREADRAQGLRYQQWLEGRTKGEG